jgi:TolA-binding protein
MNENLLKYNQAIALIQKGNYGEAEKYLRDIAHTGHTLSNWALGLIYAATGRPFAALKHWERISPDEVEAVSEKMKKLQQKLPIYEEIFTLYNEAISTARQKNFDLLPPMYLKILKKGEGLPLPIEIYKGLFLSLLLQGDLDYQFNKALDKAPEYVKMDVSIKSIVLKVKEASLKTQVHQIEKKSVRRTRIASAILLTGTVSLVLTAGIAFGGIGKNEQVQPVFTKEKAKSAVQGNDELEKEFTAKLDSLTQENAVLQAEVDKKSAVLQENSETENLLKLADINIEEVKEEAALKLYQSGIESYRNHRYQEAVEKLTKSLAISKASYYTDDAHFFLISSSIKLGDQGSAITKIDDFLNEMKREFYKESPYMDDVMLMRAESYLESGDKENAMKWLNRIESEYPNEWTSKRAKFLVNN